MLHRRSLLKIAIAASAGTLVPTEVANAAHAAVSSLVPDDRRSGGLKDLNGYFPFAPPASPAAWAQRAEYLRRQIRVACGLWPMPARPVIQATVHGQVQRDDYTVDRVFFESSPGLLVTGSLYRPAEVSGKLPTILCPHGHWADGRFHDHGDAQIQKELESGAETDPVGGRHPLQARCVQLARMGCMVFLYDMLGYADGSSLSYELTHRFAKQRPHMSQPDNWGLFSAQSELRCINALGLQTWNSIRTLDWITSRNDCDQNRVGITGASGGGTQTFILTAIDQRIKASFPAVMVSTAMQGGCTCENASLLRVNTGNIEFAALAAPRPLAMTGADDWTVEIESKGLPQLRELYQMLGAPDQVTGQYLKFPHNYNLRSRMLMYNFFNQAFSLGHESIEERPYQPLTRDEATVFNHTYPAPDKSEAAEVALLRAIGDAAVQQILHLVPGRRSEVEHYRNTVGGALDIMIGRKMPAAGSTSWKHLLTCTNTDGSTSLKGMLQLPEYGEEIPLTWVQPQRRSSEVVLWFDSAGTSGLFEADGFTPIPAVRKLLRRRFSVISADVYLTGAFTDDGLPVKSMPVVQNPREFAGFTLGYNHSLFSQRVHDILSVISHATSSWYASEKTYLVSGNGMGPHAACAAATAQSQLAGAAIDTGGFRFAAITEIRDADLLPGAVRYGDLPGLLALAAPLRMAVAGESSRTFQTPIRVWRAAGGSLRLLNDNSSVNLADQILRMA